MEEPITLEQPIRNSVAYKDKTITYEDFKRFFNAIKDDIEPYLVLYWENLYLLALETGARLCELIELKRDNFDLESKQLRYTIKKKIYRYNSVKPLSDALVLRFKKHFRQYSTEINVNQGCVFFSLHYSFIGHTSVSNVRKIHQKLCNKIGLKKIYMQSIDGRFLNRFTFHSIRHLSGQLICDKFGLYACKNHLNHGNINSTLHYLDDSQDQKKEIARLFNKLMDNDDSKDMVFQLLNLLVQNKVQNNKFGDIKDSNILLGDNAKFLQKK